MQRIAIAAGLIGFMAIGQLHASTTPVIGPNGTTNVAIDTSACTAEVEGRKLSLPESAKGEDCVIRPIGGLRDGQLLIQVGKPGYLADETVALVVAVSPESGKALRYLLEHGV